MRKRLSPSILVLCLIGMALPVYAQGTPKKKGPTVQELQQQVIELQGKLMECQNTAKANAPSPMKDALEAFQTFNSTVDTGVNQAAYKAALVPLKVKVDKLPDNEQTAPMKRTLEMLVDAGQLWNISITRNENMRGLAVPLGYVQSYIDRYKDDWQAVDSAHRRAITYPCENPISADWQKYYAQRGEKPPRDVSASCVKNLGVALMEKGQENVKGFPKP